MSKIKIIEKKIEELSPFSVENLSEVKGGTIFNCTSGSELRCTPFTGQCLKVTIGEDTYECVTSEGVLKKGECSIAILSNISPAKKYQVLFF